MILDATPGSGTEQAYISNIIDVGPYGSRPIDFGPSNVLSLDAKNDVKYVFI